MAVRKGDPEPTAPAATIEPDRPVRLPSAGGSTDPAVHHLIAELGTARSNGDTAAEARIVGQLQTLGYSA
jgi:hypothetical protein